MYHHPGEYVTDFCIVQRGDLYHLFHIRGERWTWTLGYKELDLGHATSSDLQSWTAHEPVLPAGAAGAWDECGNWAPDIFEHDDVYYCYYTGSDSNNNQAIGLATSSDLFQWTKHASNPVVEPGDWSDRLVGKDVAGRDAMVFHDAKAGRYLLYYTATMADGRACLAVAESHDRVTWQDCGPTLIEADRTYNRLESAYLVEHGGLYYLFYSAKGGPKSKGFAPGEFAHFDIVYVIGSSPMGPWKKPINHELLTEWTCASEHPTFNGVTYMLYIIQEEIAGIWGASTLSDPKRIEWMADGTVEVREHLPEDFLRQPIYSHAVYNPTKAGANGWVQHGGRWQWGENGVTSPAVNSDSFAINPLWGRDLAFEAEVLVAPGAVSSLIVRGNPSALAGYRIFFDADQETVGIAQMTPGQPEKILQQRRLNILSNRWHKLKVVVQGAFFDVYVDNALLIVRHERTYPDGCFGLHARGNVQFRNLRAERYDAPKLGGVENEQEDWSTRCQPRHLFPG